MDLAFLDIDLLRDIDWNMTAFDRLVLPHHYKRVIRAQISGLDDFDDIIKGKGKSNPDNQRNSSANELGREGHHQASQRRPRDRKNLDVGIRCVILHLLMHHAR